MWYPGHWEDCPCASTGNSILEGRSLCRYSVNGFMIINLKYNIEASYKIERMQLFQRNNLLCKVNKSLPYSGNNSKYPWGYCSELIFLFICSQPKLWIIHLFKIEMDLNKKETFNIISSSSPPSIPPPIHWDLLLLSIFLLPPTSLCLLLIHSQAFVWFPWAYSPNSHAVSANCFVPPLLQSKCHILFECLSSWEGSGACTCSCDNH